MNKKEYDKLPPAAKEAYNNPGKFMKKMFSDDQEYGWDEFEKDCKKHNIQIVKNYLDKKYELIVYDVINKSKEKFSYDFTKEDTRRMIEKVMSIFEEDR